MIEVLKEIIIEKDKNFSLKASICIGKLGRKQCKIAINYLISIIENDYDWNNKTIALESLICHFEIYNNLSINYILNQIENSPIWVKFCSICKSSLKIKNFF